MRILSRRGLHPAVISRGYGRASRGTVIVADRERVRVGPREGGDEPVQMARKFPGVPVVVGERRFDAARAAVTQCGAGVLVSDDGFQHRWLCRDRDIVVIDGSRDLAGEPLLPAGLRREPMRGLRRAHLVGLTGVSERHDILARENGLRRWFAGPIVSIERYWESVCEARSMVRFPVERLMGSACFCFSAIGNPQRLVADLVGAGARLAGERHFRDHHWFSRGELCEIALLARRAGAGAVVTTEKDFTRMDLDQASVASLFGDLPLWVPLLAARAVPGESLETLISEMMESHP